MINKVYSKLFLSSFLQYFVLSITGMVDCAVCGRWCGTDGLTAMQLAIPVFFLLGIPSMIGGTGISIVLSRELGNGRKNNAVSAFSTVVMTAVAIGVVFTIIGMTCPSLITRCFIGFGKGQELVDMVNQYMKPILIGAVPIIILDILNAEAALEGKTFLISAVSFMMLPVDIVLDIIAVEVFRAGVTGIAYASTITYAVSVLILLIFILSRKSMLGIRPESFSLAMLRDLFISGTPHGIELLCDTVRPVLINMCMLAFGTFAGIAALNIQDSVHYLPVAVCIGTSSAFMTLSAVFFSEKDQNSLEYLRKNISVKVLCCITVISAILWIAAPALVSLFTVDQDVIRLANTAFRLYLIGVPFAAFNGIIHGYLEGINKVKLSSGYIVFDKLIIPLICTYVLGSMYGVTGIYAAFAVSEIITSLTKAALLFFRGSVRAEIFDPLRDYVKSGFTCMNMDVTELQGAADVSKNVMDFCMKNGVSERLSYHAALCMEELVSNILRHGFQPEKKNHLNVRVAIDDESIVLRSRDDCNQFDITERYSILETDEKSSCLGIKLIYAASDKIDYTSALDLNNICIHIMRQEGEQYVINK